MPEFVTHLAERELLPFLIVHEIDTGDAAG